MGPHSRIRLLRVEGRTDCQIFEMVPGGGDPPPPGRLGDGLRAYLPGFGFTRPGASWLAHLAGLCGLGVAIWE